MVGIVVIRSAGERLIVTDRVFCEGSLWSPMHFARDPNDLGCIWLVVLQFWAASGLFFCSSGLDLVCFSAVLGCIPWNP